MNNTELPLLELFNRLREHGLPLGIDDYLLILRALQGGFGVESRGALEQLCCTLWTKSDDEIDLFHRLFEQIVLQPIVPVHKSLSETPTASSSHESTELFLPISSASVAAQTMSPNFTVEIDALMQVISAVQRKIPVVWELRRPHYGLSNEYFPVTPRQMKQSWRNLRYLVREGLPEEVDVEATVEKIGRDGVFLGPVLLPLRSNRARLVLLIDQDGSMVPFHALSRQLIETAQRGGRLEETNVYYFHDYPDVYLYRDTARLEALSISDALEANGERSAVLIVSDAGAARGSFDAERVMQTQDFIKQIKQSVRYSAWLNPMPNTRWPRTTAGEIARFVPMFEMNRRGLDAAISALRGRYVYWEKIYSWMIP
jgi:uncharacterized protein with von Willebrand factor type A (vWA) domain